MSPGPLPTPGYLHWTLHSEPRPVASASEATRPVRVLRRVILDRPALAKVHGIFALVALGLDAHSPSTAGRARGRALLGREAVADRAQGVRHLTQV